ncbi:MAG: TRAP transporter small permease subunit [Pseudomonadota bacterium]
MSGFSRRLENVLVATGGAGLLTAMTVDGIAVFGRHVGWPLLGSIEIVQAAVFVSGSIAMLLTSAMVAHARVHLLVDRLPAGARTAMRRFGLLLGALLFLALLAGSIWIAMDMWPGHEESELLHVPYKPLRVLAVGATAGIAVAFLFHAFRSERR